MEQKISGEKFPITVQDKAFFHSDIYINLESTDVKKILVQVIHTILDKIRIYQHNGSGWYFKEVVHFEIHTVNFNPMRVLRFRLDKKIYHKGSWNLEFNITKRLSALNNYESL